MTDLTASNGSPETELHSAAWAGDVDFAIELLQKGIDVNIQDSIGESPLHGAAAWGRIDMVKFLLNHSANPNLKNQDNATPLHLACSHGNERTVELLISNGAKLIPNGQGKTPLEIAKHHNKQHIIAWLKRNT
tara:strand:+ start:100 stop:498 length:399 start_codon:yes stop_codon:yes gene_type:complete